MSDTPTPPTPPTPDPPPDPKDKAKQPRKRQSQAERGKSLHEQGIARAWQMRELGAHACAVIFFHGTDDMTVASDAHVDIVKALVRRAYAEVVVAAECGEDEEDE